MKSLACLLVVLMSSVALARPPRSSNCKDRCSEFIAICENQCKEMAGKHVKECVKQCTKVIATCESDCEKKQNKKRR